VICSSTKEMGRKMTPQEHRRTYVWALMRIVLPPNELRQIVFLQILELSSDLILSKKRKKICHKKSVSFHSSYPDSF
jgi:hypothetical protein